MEMRRAGFLVALAACAVLGAWFWSSAPDPSPRAWPRGMPEFAHGEILHSTRRSDGGAAFVSFLSPQEPRDVLASARSAFLAAGWSVSPVGTADMRGIPEALAKRMRVKDLWTGQELPVVNGTIPQPGLGTHDCQVYRIHLER